MKPYRNWAPTSFDARGLGLEDRQDWLVLGIVRTRDSGALERANWDEACAALAACSNDHEVHRFNHWGPGWFEIILIRPDSAAEHIGVEMEASLATYPVLSEERWSEYEHADADEVWRNCYTPATRLAYIRKHRSQFEFRDLADMLGCVRGHYFAGDAGELLGG